MLTDRGEVLANQDLALVFEIVVQNLEDILPVAERERVAASADSISRTLESGVW